MTKPRNCASLAAARMGRADRVAYRRRHSLAEVLGTGRDALHSGRIRGIRAPCEPRAQIFGRRSKHSDLETVGNQSKMSETLLEQRWRALRSFTSGKSRPKPTLAVVWMPRSDTFLQPVPQSAGASAAERRTNLHFIFGKRGDSLASLRDDDVFLPRVEPPCVLQMQRLGRSSGGHPTADPSRSSRARCRSPRHRRCDNSGSARLDSSRLLRAQETVLLSEPVYHRRRIRT